MPAVPPDHEMSEEEDFYGDDSGSSESDQDPPPEPDSDIEELESEDFPKYFVERKRRLFHSTDAPYPLPVDGPEIQRQNLMHRMYRRLLGAHYVGPVHEVLDPDGHTGTRQVLDLGTGTGVWVMDMGREYRQSQVIGVDIVPIATRFPRRNVRFELHDIREPLRWADGTFDLIHARDLSMGIGDWLALINEVARLLRPGGLFISCEWVLSPTFRPGVERDPATHAPASMRFFSAIERGLAARGVIMVGNNVRHYLEASQRFYAITEEPHCVGVGEEPQGEAESRIGHDLSRVLQKFTRSVIPLLRENGLTRLQIGELIGDYLGELDNPELGLAYVYDITYARKI